MDLTNKLYKNQGLHVDIAIFTVSGKETKILLVKRGNAPEVGKWMLPGGAVYNNESLDFAAKREFFEKTGIKNIYLEQVYAFGDPKRDPRKRMAAIAYLALVNSKKLKFTKQTKKTLDCRWFVLKEIPDLLFDHNQILEHCFSRLRQRITSSNIAVNILPKYFTLPQLQQFYEIILNKNMDRRNFRKKFLGLGLIKKNKGRTASTGYRPANLYSFKSRTIQNTEIL